MASRVLPPSSGRGINYVTPRITPRCTHMPGTRQGLQGPHRRGMAMWLALAGTILHLTVAAPAHAQLDPNAIIDRVDRLLRGESSRGVATMEIVTEHWERQMTMEIWSLGTDYSLVRLRAPRREAGTATLKAAEDIWNYLPKVDRTIKVPASMMGGSWMGSHFTNDDLVKDSRLVEDYDIELVFDGEDAAGVAVWDFRLTPRPEAPVVWGHIDYRIRQSDDMPIRAEFFDEDGELARTIEHGDYTEFSGRIVPGVMNMYPADKPDERTTIRYEELEFDIDVEPSFFSLRTLQRGG
ncbi:MAG: outer membrane lipoprotein-sorting protein [Gammaproteobacteria bacterium]|nr:outer membrane lipoprotein-sorting protein [Gammaproteobacteria bacterium]